MLKLSIIMPVFNEQATIRKVIENVNNAKIELSKEIVIVDDCSNDGTKDILRKINDSSVKIFFHQKNMGKGTAIRTGLKNATGDILLIQDADLEYNPAEYKKLLLPIIEGKTKVVYGSRIESIRKNIKNMNKVHYLGNQFLTFATNMIYGAKITDMETGYKVFSREVIEKIKLRARRFDFEPEITAKILKNGYKIYEVPIDFKARKFNEGKKITFIDGIKAFYYLLKYRFVD